MLLLALPLCPLAMSKSSAGPAAEKSDLLEISTAIVEQLKALPSIGDAYSEKIIKGRPCQWSDALV